MKKSPAFELIPFIRHPKKMGATNVVFIGDIPDDNKHGTKHPRNKISSVDGAIIKLRIFFHLSFFEET